MPLRWRGGSKSLTKVSGSDHWVQCTLYTHVRYPVSVRPLCNELPWKTQQNPAVRSVDFGLRPDLCRHHQNLTYDCIDKMKSIVFHFWLSRLAIFDYYFVRKVHIASE